MPRFFPVAVAVAIAVAVAVTVIVASPSVAHARKKPPTLTIPLRIKVASCPDKAGKLVPVRDDKWLKKHLQAARKIFSRHGIQLMEIVEPFTPARCTLLTRAHRYAAAADMEMDGKATVLIFKRVRDVDVLTYNLMGVHWRYRGKETAHEGKRWVFLTARAKIPVLAHELCHFFGLPHDKAGGNLMTPGPSDPIYKDKDSAKPAGFKAVLTGAQVKRLRRGINKFLKTGK